MLVVFQMLISHLKTLNFIKELKKVPIKTKFLIKRIYRLINFRRCSHYVWKDLIKFHKASGWKFGQFEADKLIECTFEIEENSFLNFNYLVNNHSLIFRSIILQNFEEERTNDIMVLASHFNALLNFGVVKVSVKYNYVEFIYTRDLLTYSLFSGEIRSDTDTHFAITKDCLWSFTKLIETGDDPVFVFSELMRRKENYDSTDN